MIGSTAVSLDVFVRAVGLAAALACAGPAMAQLPAEDVQLNWPIGDVVDGAFVPGKNVSVMQDFGNANPGYDGRRHAGVDLTRDAGGVASIGWNVRAAASGVVACVAYSGYPGAVVVIRHTGKDGRRFQTQYGHIAIASGMRVGNPVVMGQVIGTIIEWPNDPANSHLHFEVRNDTYDAYRPEDCVGPGYATAGRNPVNEGWEDPVNQVYRRRPAFPRWLITDGALYLRSGPSLQYPIVASVPANARAFGYGVQRQGSDWWYRVAHPNQYGEIQYLYMPAFLKTGWGGDVHSTDW